MSPEMLLKRENRIVNSKVTCVCAETGTEIRQGESCLFVPSEKAVYSRSSKMYRKHIIATGKFKAEE